MSKKFSDFMKELEAETRREGPEAVAEAEALQAHFKLATELILLRKRRKLTQRQLSALSGIQQSEISRIEAGAGNPTLATMSVLVRALGAELRLTPNVGARRAVAARAAARVTQPAR
jgi:predicted XRE-type DNA-binding protein